MRTARVPLGSLSLSRLSLGRRLFRPADIPGHVEQAARRVHAGRIQDMRPGRTSPWPAAATGAVMVRPGHLAASLAAPADEYGDHQHDQAERDTRRARIQFQAAHVAPRRPRRGPDGQAWVIRVGPSVTVAAPATDRTTTARILLPVGLSERTAQPSHRGYRPASHMARCNHYGRYC
jgi:hypothetical protein